MSEALICFGELLIDMVAEPGETVESSSLFHRAPGGAPANVAVGLTRLGRRAALIGKVADDPFGRFLQATLAKEGVDMSGLICDPKARTPLAFVGAGAASERSFIFYHRGMADSTICIDDLDPSLLQRARVFHFGSVTLSAEPAKGATLWAVDAARNAGSLVSFDPNIRLELWDSAAEATDQIRAALGQVDVIKLSLDEVRLLTGKRDPDDGALQLLRDGPSLAIVTLGAEGAYYATPTSSGHVPGFRVPVIDATGAGDGFMAGLLFALAHNGAQRDALSRPELLGPAIQFANAVGALTTTGYGAIPSLPTGAEVSRLIEKPLAKYLEGEVQ